MRLRSPRSTTYVVASLACDFHVAEAVDLTQVVVGKIPKGIFSDETI
jgi:acetamidase/formamidase